MKARSPELLFEWLAESRIVVLCEGRGEPSTHEWEAYLTWLGRLPQLDELRVFVDTAGGRPSRTQQHQLMELTGDRHVKVAVVSSSMALRFVVSVFALINREIRHFTPAELDQAFAHLGCTREESAAIGGAVDRLRLALAASSSTSSDHALP